MSESVNGMTESDIGMPESVNGMTESDIGMSESVNGMTESVNGMFILLQISMLLENHYYCICITILQFCINIRRFDT
jgi:hypothetical protein